MLQTITPREVETSGTLESTTFSIKTDAKAFKILIDNLYSDKITSIIRELWTNAYDAHKLAGIIETPFDCALPSSFEPFFAVRDFGVSMTHKEVMEVYSVVFESTKDKDNLQVGSFGLGSKSPWAYADTFTLECWLDGRKRTYSAYMNSASVPQIDLMADEDSDEPKGVRVSFPVDSMDYIQFKDAAKSVARGFYVLPTINGEPQACEMPDPVAKGKDWAAYKKWSVGDTFARQGCVLYPISLAEVTKHVTDDCKLLACGEIIIDFPIGDIAITPSREAIQYTPETCKNIAKRAEEIEKHELAAAITEMINDAPTYWEARQRAGEALQALGMIGGADNLYWHGKKIELKKKIHLGDFKKYGVAWTGCTRFDMRKRKHLKWSSQNDLLINAPSSYIFYVENTANRCTHVGPRIKKHWKAGGSVTQHQDTDVIWIKADTSSHAFKKLMKQIGYPPIISVNGLEKPPPEAAGSGFRRKVSYKKLDSGGTIVDDYDFDIDEGGLYFAMDRNEVCAPGSIYASNYSIHSIVKTLKTLGVIQVGQKVTGVPKSCGRAVFNSDKWTNLFELTEMTLKATYDPAAAGKLIRTRELLDEKTHWQNLAKALLDKLILPDDDMGLLHEFVSWYRDVSESIPDPEKVEALGKLQTSIRWTAPTEEEDATDITKSYGDIQTAYEASLPKAYPMLELSLKTGWRSDLNADMILTMLEYTNLIDSQRENK